MSYLVLARKYRPQYFDDVIGQEHITELLKKAIRSDRVAHAYLFSGPRGIGKTSCARILAKSLNCGKGITLKPCEECAACKEIAQGTSFDVLEIDGASNRGIDEIRALRENVKFAPSYGRFKIYIVDEVHMLTTEAFNALLKTLEEPPAHVKFIFATTNPNKVPATIISRCQKFDFKRITIKTLVEGMAEVSKKEGLKINQDALYAIGKAAQGSLRDALSILDQLSALSEEGIEADDVCSMLGLVEIQLLFDLTDAIGQKNCSQSLKILESIIDKGKDVKQLTRDMIEHFRNLMVIKVGGKSLGRLVDYPVAIKEMLLDQCTHFSLKDILKAIDMFIEAQETARITESMRMPFEIALAKLTYREDGQVPAMPPHNQATPYTAAPTNKNTIPLKEAGPSKITSKKVIQDDISDEIADEIIEEPLKDSIIEAPIVNLEHIKHAWNALTYAVSREKMSAATYLQEGVPVELKDSTLIIGFPETALFQKETLEDSQNVTLVQEVFSTKLNKSIVVRYQIIDDYVRPDEDAVVQSALDTFNGEVVNRWHQE